MTRRLLEAKLTHGQRHRPLEPLGHQRPVTPVVPARSLPAAQHRDLPAGDRQQLVVHLAGIERGELLLVLRDETCGVALEGPGCIAGIEFAVQPVSGRPVRAGCLC